MGLTKTALYTPLQNELSGLLKAMAHPARIAILEFLLKSESCINGELVQEIGLSQATISQHLKELKAVGIIRGTIDKASMNYCINPEKWNAIQEVLNHFFNQLKLTAPDCC